MRRRPRLSSTSSALAVALAGLACAAGQVSAQAESASPWYGRAAVGGFAVFPDQFNEPWCEQGAWAASAALGRRITSTVAVEVGVAAGNGRGGMMCAIPLMPAPFPGDLYADDRYGDGVQERDFQALSMTAAFTAWASGGQSVEARFGSMWLMDKRILAGTGGFAYVFRVGRHQLEAGYEAWLMRVPFDLDIYRAVADGPDLLVSSQRRSDTAGALQLTVGYRYTLR